MTKNEEVELIAKCMHCSVWGVILALTR